MWGAHLTGLDPYLSWLRDSCGLTDWPPCGRLIRGSQGIVSRCAVSLGNAFANTQRYLIDTLLVIKDENADGIPSFLPYLIIVLCIS